jgi:hypothetical protein
MGIVDWLFRVEKDARVAENTPIPFDRDEEEFHGLNMKAAIDAHRQWKERLEMTLAGTSGETLEVERVAADHHCVLGQWLHGEARKRFAKTAEYRDLVKSHSEFHLVAGDILCNAHAGETTIAHEKLHTVFRRCSDRVRLDVIRLYARHKERLNR